jgi:hypothetical protein
MINHELCAMLHRVSASMKRSDDNAFRQQKAQQTRARILEALIDQIGRGHEDFAIADVARAAAAVSVLNSGEVAIALMDRFGIEGEDMIRSHCWIVRVVAEAIARGNVPRPAEGTPQ